MNASKGIARLKVVDTNVFVHYLLEGDRADEAERLLASHLDLAVTVGIIDEVEFVIIRRLAKERLGIRELSKLKEYIRKRGLDFAVNVLEKYTEMLYEFDIRVLKRLRGTEGAVRCHENVPANPERRHHSSNLQIL